MSLELKTQPCSPPLIEELGKRKGERPAATTPSVTELLREELEGPWPLAAPNSVKAHLNWTYCVQEHAPEAALWKPVGKRRRTERAKTEGERGA